MKPYTLEWWFSQYDLCIDETDSLIHEDQWLREHYGRPYDDELVSELKDIDYRLERYHYLQEFIRERIIKKYGE